MPPQLTKFKNSHTTGDLDRLKKLLNRMLSKVSERSYLDKESLQILNLACGRADEAAVITECFGNSAKEINLTGVDIRDREIGYAKERWANMGDNINTDFLVQDGSKLSEVSALNENFDIAFMRHQNYWDDDTTWSKIYDGALERLNDNGLLVITSYFDQEHHLAIKAIKNLGAELLLSEQHLESRMISNKYTKSADRHIALFKKL